jgi:hypothetical protein
MPQQLFHTKGPHHKKVFPCKVSITGGRSEEGSGQRIEVSDLSIHHCVFGQVARSLENVLVLAAERFALSRIQAQLAIRVDLQSAVSIELDLVHPSGTIRQLSSGQTFHRFNEASFAAGESSGSHEETAIPFRYRT